jgi:hypothetical protein
LVLVGLSGCGSSKPPPPDRLTACEVVQRAEVAAILGRPVAPPDESSGAATDTLAGRSGCAWSSQDERMAVLIELVRTGDMSSSVRRTGFSAAARFEAVRHEHPDAHTPEVAGSHAVYVEEGAALHVLTGRSYLTIEVAATPPGVVQPIAIDLARRAVSRLQEADGAD